MTSLIFLCVDYGGYLWSFYQSQRLKWRLSIHLFLLTPSDLFFSFFHFFHAFTLCPSNSCERILKFCGGYHFQQISHFVVRANLNGVDRCKELKRIFLVHKIIVCTLSCEFFFLTNHPYKMAWHLKRFYLRH